MLWLKLRRVLPGLLGLALLAGPLAAHAEWKRAESDHFIVYGHTDKTVRDYATMLEDFDDMLRAVHGRSAGDGSPRKLPVYLVRNQDELRRLYPEAPPYTAGLYFPTLTEVFAVAVRSEDNENDWNKGDDIALHEYVHHFMMQYYANAYPAWLVEGYAEYYMTASLENDRRVIGDYNRWRGDALVTPSLVWLPAEDLLSKRLSELGKWDGQMYYAQSWLLTHYILTNPKRAALLPRYLDAVRGGQAPTAAWKAVFGTDPAKLNGELRQYLRRSLQVRVLPREERFKAKVTVTAMPSGPDDLLLDNQRLKLGVAKADQAKVLASIRSEAGRSTGHFAQMTLARAEVTLGDRARGQAILNTLLAANPNDEEALVLLGESYMATGYADETQRKAAFDVASTLFARAFKIDPNNPTTLHGYADARSLEPLTDNLVNVRIRAVEIAPQISHLRLDAAQALIEKKRFGDARTLLAPVASNPHGDSNTEAARKLMESLPAK